MFNIYEKLDDDNKEKIVRLAEGLLNSQKVMSEEKTNISPDDGKIETSA